MTDVPIASHSFCVVSGCSDHATRERIIVTGPGSEQTVAVCEKHAEGALDLDDLFTDDSE